MKHVLDRENLNSTGRDMETVAVSDLFSCEDNMF